MSDTEFDCEPKRQKRNEEDEEAGKEENAENEDDDEKKTVPKTLLQEQSVPSDLNSSSFVAQTANVKDIEVLLKACCKLEGVATVLIVFDREGMQAMSLPDLDKAASVHLFYSKEKFKDYNVTTTHSYHVDAKKLFELTQKLKYVDLLSVHNRNGSYAFCGTKRYSKGGVGEFMISIDSEENPKVTSQEHLQYLQKISSNIPDLKITVSSSNFIENYKFFKSKPKIEEIEIVASGNKLVLKCHASHGLYTQKEISQPLLTEVDTLTNMSCFVQWRYMEVISQCSEHLNEALCIRMKLNDRNAYIHFMFEVGHRSHFSLYVAPVVKD